MTRQRREACQPGATPRGRVPVNVPPYRGGGLDPETQGVALGLYTPALSPPDPRSCKSGFTTFDGCGSRTYQTHLIIRHSANTPRYFRQPSTLKPLLCPWPVCGILFC